ncbi:hypothetical protein [Microbulbifer epialgicus]|uniref:Uncharacterized protein n=1 Tax=Microbulbifer epialgicus TaxID=393907 RepID=A0ABV4NVH7_9GAMM
MKITIEDMITEGSLTPKQAYLMGYRWDSIVVGGDALEVRKKWLESQKER